MPWSSPSGAERGRERRRHGLGLDPCSGLRSHVKQATHVCLTDPVSEGDAKPRRGFKQKMDKWTGILA